MEGRWPVKVAPLPWYGGKQAQSKAEWIAGLLPWRKRSLYCEPFGGMATVMARRAPVSCEIYNDLDGHAVNWWRMWRERPEEMTDAVVYTPFSREEYEWSYDNLDKLDDPIERARAFHVMVNQGIRKSTDSSRASWDCAQSHTSGTKGKWKRDRCEILIDRFRNVNFENVDAMVLLGRLTDCDNAVIYCDPPYHSAKYNQYIHSEIDVTAMTDVILAQKGEVALSGYGTEWDHLGWQSHEKESQVNIPGEHAKNGARPRTEVLWTNYDVMQSIGGLFA